MQSLAFLPFLVVSLFGAEPVAIVSPAKPDGKSIAEYHAAHDAARNMASMLREAGIGFQKYDETLLTRGALPKRPIVVLPYNPKLDPKCVDALLRFQAAGGKLVLCYALDPRLGKALGFGPSKYVKQERVGQFAEMRFDADDIAGLPKSVQQASWNLTAVKPVGHNAKVIGTWYDDAGKPHQSAGGAAERSRRFFHAPRAARRFG